MASIKHGKGRKKGGKTQFPGIGEDAFALGCTPNHLWRVITNKRASRSLMCRYQELKESQAQTALRDKSQTELPSEIPKLSLS